jgi:hypothetical protein
LEFIATRNSAAVLERYSRRLWELGFVVTFGSEHNTPAAEPVRLSTRGGTALTETLREINYRGACVVAAHQAEYARTARAYDPTLRDGYAALGDKLIKQAIDG